MSRIISFISLGMFLVFVSFFSIQLQTIVLKVLAKLTNKIGLKVQNTEIFIQRYMFIRYDSIIAKFYRWINEQVICLGLKKFNVTPVGFFTFWCIMSLPITIVVNIVLKSSIVFSLASYVLILVMLLLLIRIKTASSLEKREELIMTSIDMIVPNIGSGVQNAINRYKDIFPVELRDEYRAFIDRIVTKSTPFADSMIILADSIGGSIFNNFAQKAIFFEETGDNESKEIFADIVETNRLRRDLRYEIKNKFDELKNIFIVSSIIVWLYIFVIALREDFTKNFVFNTNIGQILFIADIMLEVAVMVFITSIRAREI